MNKLSIMVKGSKKPIIGIVGGICSGKSTVAAELGKLGCGAGGKQHLAFNTEC